MLVQSTTKETRERERTISLHDPKLITSAEHLAQYRVICFDTFLDYPSNVTALAELSKEK